MFIQTFHKILKKYVFALLLFNLLKSCVKCIDPSVLWSKISLIKYNTFNEIQIVWAGRYLMVLLNKNLYKRINKFLNIVRLGQS